LLPELRTIVATERGRAVDLPPLPRRASD